MSKKWGDCSWQLTSPQICTVEASFHTDGTLFVHFRYLLWTLCLEVGISHSTAYIHMLLVLLSLLSNCLRQLKHTFTETVCQLLCHFQVHSGYPRFHHCSKSSDCVLRKTGLLSTKLSLFIIAWMNLLTLALDRHFCSASVVTTWSISVHARWGSRVIKPWYFLGFIQPLLFPVE